jgi:hypothetical protein
MTQFTMTYFTGVSRVVPFGRSISITSKARSP